MVKNALSVHVQLDKEKNVGFSIEGIRLGIKRKFQILDLIEYSKMRELQKVNQQKKQSKMT